MRAVHVVVVGAQGGSVMVMVLGDDWSHVTSNVILKMMKNEAISWQLNVQLPEN